MKTVADVTFHSKARESKRITEREISSYQAPTNDSRLEERKKKKKKKKKNSWPTPSSSKPRFLFGNLTRVILRHARKRVFLVSFAEGATYPSYHVLTTRFSSRYRGESIFSTYFRLTKAMLFESLRYLRIQSRTQNDRTCFIA